MNAPRIQTLLVFALLAGACSTPTELETDDVETSEDSLSKGDPLPAFPSFAPVRIVESVGGACVGKGPYSRGFDRANVADCGPDARRHYAIVPTEDGHYLFRNYATGACLDVLRAETADGTPVIEWGCNGGDHQKWRATELSAGRYRLQAVHSGKCLELDSSSMLLRASTCRTGAPNQTFLFHEGVGTQIRVNLQAGGGYAKCLDVAGGSHDDDVRIQQWDCWRPSRNQRFYALWFPGHDDDHVEGYELRAAHSGKCITVLDGGDQNGTPLVQSECIGGSHQRFATKQTPAGREIHPRHVDKCVDRASHVTAKNGALLQLWACGGGQPNQTFSMDVDLDGR